MKKIDDIVLMHYAEGVLGDPEVKEIKNIVASNKELIQKVEMFKKTFKILKEFGSLLEKRKKTPKKEPLPSNIIQISEYLAQRFNKKRDI